MSHFRCVIKHDVRACRMLSGIVLMVSLSSIERLQRGDLGDDGSRKDLRLLQLRNVRLGNPLLLIVSIENDGSVLSAFIRPLTIQLCRIMGHGEEDLQQLSVGDSRRIVLKLYRFRVPGFSSADEFVLGSLGRAPGIPRSGTNHSLYVLEDSLDSPKTAPCHNRGLFALARSQLSIYCGAWQSHGCFSGNTAGGAYQGHCQQQTRQTQEKLRHSESLTGNGYHRQLFRVSKKTKVASS